MIVVATVKSAKNKEVQLIQETERGEIQPKPQTEVKQVRRIVPVMVAAAENPAMVPVPAAAVHEKMESMAASTAGKEPAVEEMRP